MPAKPIVDYLWRLVRENPDVIPQIVKIAKEKFGSSEPPPAGAPPPPPSAPEGRSDAERIDQLETGIASAGRLIGVLESRLDDQAQRLQSTLTTIETRLARAEAHNTRLAARLRTAIIAFAIALAAALALLVYLLAR
ncbi:MAG: hypothetical protein ACM336_06480 [Acidobacteriota bacterium]